MSLAAEIKSGYKSIATAQGQDKVKAYTEYHQFLNEAEISVEDIQAASSDMNTAVQIIEESRRKRITIGSSKTKLLRGSGIVVMGDRFGDILAASYLTEANGEDLVAKQYPGYQKVALRKMGQAAMVGNVNATQSMLRGKYRLLQEILLEAGLLGQDDPPHHLGYAAVHSFMVGASGMLPSDEVAEQLSLELAPELEADRSRGWVEWPHDEFAGAIDLAVADDVLYRDVSFVRMDQLIGCIREWHAIGINVH
jgi:hypothetical protein